MDVWVLDDVGEDFDTVIERPVLVFDGEGTIDPETWVVDHAVHLYPNTIYFFAELTSPEV